MGGYWQMDEEIRDKLAASLKAGVSEEAMAAIKKAVDGILEDIETDVMYRLKDDLGQNLSTYAADMAQKAVERLLDGNEGEMRRYLSCERRAENGDWIYPYYNGRSDGYHLRGDILEQHPIIHGELFEQGCVALRKRIVEAHRDLLVTERIADLEDQVKSLVEQVNRKEAEIERWREKYRQVA